MPCERLASHCGSVAVSLVVHRQVQGNDGVATVDVAALNCECRIARRCRRVSLAMPCERLASHCGGVAVSLVVDSQFQRNNTVATRRIRQRVGRGDGRSLGISHTAPRETFASHDRGVARGGQSDRNRRTGRIGTASGRLQNGHRILTVHTGVCIGDSRVLLVGAEAIRAAPCEAHARSLVARRRKFDVSTLTRGVDFGLHRHGVADSLDCRRCRAGTSILVLHRHRVSACFEAREGRLRLEVSVAESVGVIVARRHGYHNTAVQFVTARVVRNDKRRRSGQRINRQVEGINLRTNVVIQMTVEVIATIRDDSVGAANPFPGVAVANCNRKGGVYRIVDSQVQRIHLRATMGIQMAIEIVATIRDDSVSAASPFPSVALTFLNRHGCMHRVVDGQVQRIHLRAAVGIQMSVGTVATGGIGFPITIRPSVTLALLNRDSRVHRIVDSQVQGIHLPTVIIILVTVGVNATIRDDSVGAANSFPSIALTFLDREGGVHWVIDGQVQRHH